MKYTASFYIQGLARALHGKSEKEQENILRRLNVVLQKNGDTPLHKEVLRGASTIFAFRQNEARARIVSAIVPTEKEKQMLKKVIPAEEYEFEINKNILGGLVIQQGTKLYLNTLYHAIRQINKQ